MTSRLIENPSELRDNIKNFGKELAGSSQLQTRLGTFKRWYAWPEEDGTFALGPRKFIGHYANTAAEHIRHGGGGGLRHGNDGEDVFGPWFRQVATDSAEHRRLWRELKAMFEPYGRQPHPDTWFFVALTPQAGEPAARPPPVQREGWVVHDPEICSGRPTLRGTRIRVADVLQMLAGGETVESLLEDYPSLRREHVQAALAFAAQSVDHRLIRAA